MAKKTYKTGSGKTSYPSDVSEEEWAFCAPYLDPVRGCWDEICRGEECKKVRA